MKSIQEIFPRACIHCGKPFVPKKSFQKMCSEECRQYRRCSRFAGKIPAGTVGAIAELEVATDLMGKGYDVFRSLSPSSSCDLAVVKNGKLTRVEVTSGWLNCDGKIGFVPHKIENFDVLAVRVRDGIHYFPPLDEVIT